MKKILIVSTLLSLLFTSCFTPVFYNISKEVPPEQATVVGVINSLVRYKASDTEYFQDIPVAVPCGFLKIFLPHPGTLHRLLRLPVPHPTPAAS